MKVRINKRDEVIFIIETGFDCYDIGRLVEKLKIRGKKYSLSYDHNNKTLMHIEIPVKTILDLLVNMEED